MWLDTLMYSFKEWPRERISFFIYCNEGSVGYQGCLFGIEEVNESLIKK